MCAATHLSGNEVIQLLPGKHNGQWHNMCCMLSLFMDVKLPLKPYVASVGQKQLVNLCIHAQAVDFLCS